MTTEQHIPTGKRAYSITEAMAASSIKRTLIYKEIAEGRLRTRKIGRRTVILASDLEDWLTEAA